jgi:hypothetical protein
MHAMIGDRLVVRGRTVGSPERYGVVTEVRGSADGPPFMVRWDDGHEGLFFPGSDSAVQVRTTPDGEPTPA